MTRSEWWPAPVRAAAPVLGALAAAAAARISLHHRRQLRRDNERMRILADLAGVANGGETAEQIARAIADLLVPRLVHVCAIDMLRADGRVHRIAARVGGGSGSGEPLARDVVAGAGGDSGDPASLSRAVVRRPAVGRGRVRRPAFDGADLRDLARDDAEVARLEELRIASAIAVPLTPRGHTLGRLLLATRPPRPPLADDADVAYVTTLAGRVALALDNVALSAELSSAEQQLQLILASVDAAVTVRDRNGRMVYANQAAADLLKLPDPAAVMAAPPGDLMGRFDVYTEAGEPLDLGDMPGTRLLLGELAPPAITVRNVVKATGEERWLLNKARGVTGSDGRIELAVNLIEDVTDAKRSEIAQRLLARTGRALAEAPDLAATLQATTEAAVPGLADWAGVDLIDEAGRIRVLAIAHRDPDRVALGWRLRTEWPSDLEDPAGVAAVIRTGEPRLVRDIGDEALVRTARDPEHLAVLRAVGLNSVMIAPIRAGERVLGALSFVSSTSRRFDARDLELADDLGRQIGIVIDRAELHAAQTHIAHTLQEGLIPPTLPAIDGWELSSAYRAAGRANEVGGDFYDVITFIGGWVAVIGDVVGKGAEAAALTALARHTLAAIVQLTGDVAPALSVLNRRLCERDGDASLCTVCAVQVDDDGAVRVFSAGHPLPLLRTAAGVAPAGAPSPMLGFLPTPEIAATPVAMEPGDQLVLYTDGVLDALGTSGRFGESRLVSAVGGLGGGEPAADVLLAAIDEFAVAGQVDDIAILSLTRAPVPAATLPPAPGQT
ncbi:MAG TPA: SpoIIE family protein phosphatase [Solirubrobacteraceae bacterium]|nr:SpoIIE family protein phosphatase [Solirubrobacteraceae bacterium]